MINSHLLMSISRLDWNPIAPWLMFPLIDLKSRAIPKSAQRRSNSWVKGTPLSRLDWAGALPQGIKTSQDSTQTRVKKTGTVLLFEARTITCPLEPWLTCANWWGLTRDGLKRWPCCLKFNAPRRYLKFNIRSRKLLMQWQCLTFARFSNWLHKVLWDLRT